MTHLPRRLDLVCDAVPCQTYQVQLVSAREAALRVASWQGIITGFQIHQLTQGRLYESSVTPGLLSVIASNVALTKSQSHKSQNDVELWNHQIACAKLMHFRHTAALGPSPLDVWVVWMRAGAPPCSVAPLERSTRFLLRLYGSICCKSKNC